MANWRVVRWWPPDSRILVSNCSSDSSAEAMLCLAGFLTGCACTGKFVSETMGEWSIDDSMASGSEASISSLDKSSLLPSLAGSFVRNSSPLSFLLRDFISETIHSGVFILCAGNANLG